MPKEPYASREAKKRVMRLLASGLFVVFEHCEAELAKDDLTVVDAVNVLRCGQIREPAEEENGCWRYRVHTDRMCVVIQFEGDDGMSLVTAWRK